MDLDREGLIELRGTLARLYPTVPDIRRIARDSGLDAAAIAFDSKAVNTWSEIVEEARSRGVIGAVVEVALRDFPEDAVLRRAATAAKSPGGAEESRPTFVGKESPLRRAVEDPSVREDLTARGARLTIDDVVVDKAEKHVDLDIRLRNPGPDVANITRVEVHVLERTPAMAAYKASASYDLLISGDRNAAAVAHVLRPNEVDSFVLRLGFTKFNTSCFFKARVVVRYNGDQEATSRRVSFDSCFPSSPPFAEHGLAREITVRARRLFRLAAAQDTAGERRASEDGADQDAEPR